MITWEEFKTNKKYWVWTAIIVIVLCMICGGDSRNENRDKNNSQNVITITGHGEVQAVPDISNISLTIRKDAKTVADAQAQVAAIEVKVLESLKTNNVSDQDRKTVNASFSPKYEYNTGICTMNNCPNRSVIVGYEAFESIDLKIRKIDDTGKIIQDLGALGVTELSGPNFAIDKEDTFKDKARKEAIDDAKSKAKILAKDLGVHLGKITSFNESGNYPVPMYASAKLDSSAPGVATPAVLPVGENTISSDVTITYEIR